MARQSGSLMAELPTAEQVFAGLNEAILIVGSDHCIARINPAAEALLGTSAKHLEGHPIQQAIAFKSERLDDSLVDPDASLVARQVPLHRLDRHHMTYQLPHHNQYKT